jgi:hypothetical protein
MDKKRERSRGEDDLPSPSPSLLTVSSTATDTLPHCLDMGFTDALSDEEEEDMEELNERDIDWRKVTMYFMFDFVHSV